MHASLFHSDNATFFDQALLRSEARAIVRRAPLIQQAAAGDRVATETLHTHFWPFVREFEHAIDRHALPREPLEARFAGQRDVRRTVTALARAVREMKEEEGSHAAHWAEAGRNLGMPSLDAPVLPAVQTLVNAAHAPDMTTFFAVLAGTEFIAEELSAYLVASPAYTALFKGGRWSWGEIHLVAHEDSPSHLDVDLDLARAYFGNDGGAKAAVEASVRQTMNQFGAAAAEALQQMAHEPNS